MLELVWRLLLADFFGGVFRGRRIYVGFWVSLEAGGFMLEAFGTLFVSLGGSKRVFNLVGGS